MIRTYKCRLYPTRAQARLLGNLLRRGRKMCNAALEQRTTAYEAAGKEAECQQLPIHKMERGGAQVVAVGLAYTAQVCSGCGAVVKKNLSIRVRCRPGCGLMLARDVNAARHVLSLAVESARRGRQALTWAVGPSVA